MNFEKSVLLGQNVVLKENVLKHKSEKKIENLNRKKKDSEGDLSVGRREFLKTVAKTVAVGALGFGIGDLLREDDNAAEKGQENKNELVVKKEKTVAEENESALEKKVSPEEKPAVQESDAEKQKIEEENKNKAEKEKIKMLVENIIVAQSQIRKSKFWPKDVFTETELIAQEMAESGLKADSVSPKGAVGICQITKIALKGDFEYLAELDREKIIKIYHAVSPDDQDLDAIMEMLLVDIDLNRAVRDIHISYLYKKFYKPKSAVKNIASKIHSKEKKNELHENILAMYNMGEGNFGKLDKEEWPTETKNYIIKNKKYSLKLAVIKKELAKKGERIRDVEDIKKQILQAET